jgi:FkbM family methyltransferase
MLSRLLRLPLGLVPKRAILPILSGPSKGHKWIVGSGTHGCWIGNYERDRQYQMASILKEGDCFLDVGANVGFYSVLASRLVGESGAVYSFEPLPSNVAFIKQHIEKNKKTNINVEQVGISDGKSDWTTFYHGENTSFGSIVGTGSESIEVRLTSLDKWITLNPGRSPKLIKIDVEGAEHNVLLGSLNLLKKFYPTVLLAGHGYKAQAACIELLKSLGYSIQINKDGTIDGMYESTATYESP